MHSVRTGVEAFGLFTRRQICANQFANLHQYTSEYFRFVSPEHNHEPVGLANFPPPYR